MHPLTRLAVVCSFLCCWVVNAGAQEAKYTWKFATLAPKGIGWSKNIEDVLMPSLDKATNGELKVKWYWGGIMGDDEDCIKKMRIHQLDGIAGSAQGMTLGVPELQVLCLPFLFQSWDEVDHIRRLMTPVFEDYGEKHNVKLLYWADQDFDQLYSTSWEFNDLEDFRKAKFVVWFGQLEQEVFNALGANSVPINVPEIPSATRQGIVNAHIAPSVWVVGTQCYMVHKYINPIKIRYSPAGIITTSKGWDKLPPDYKKAVLASRDGVITEFCRRTRIDNEKAIDAMAEYGLKRVEADPAALARLQEKSRPVWDEQAGKLYPKELLEEVLFQLENYRKMKN